MAVRGSSEGRPHARRAGTLLLLLGGILLALPLGRVAYDEIAYRLQMARVPTPSPTMLSPADTGDQQGQAPADPLSPPPAPASPADEAALPSAADQPAGSGASYQISIPRIGVHYIVGEGVDNPVLDLGPGHYPQTALPGEKGNAALAGHRTIRGRPAYFYDLDQLEAGDEIHITYADRTLTFEVERVFLTSPYDLSVLSPTEHAALTLTTCDPPGSDEMRLIVQSRLVREEQT